MEGTTYAVVFSIGDGPRVPMGTIYHAPRCKIGHVEYDTLEEAQALIARGEQYPGVGFIGVLGLNDLEGNTFRIQPGILSAGWAIEQARKVVNQCQDHYYYSRLQIIE